MSALLVCAVMAHLEYNHHSCPDKAWLVCLHALAHYFLLFFFFFFTLSLLCPLPHIKISPPPFLYLSAVCPIDRFASALLMVPSFGSCVNTLDVIAILCETKKEVELKWARFSWIVLMRWLLKGFYRLCVCVCVSVCVSNRLVALGALSYLLKVGISEKLI